MPDLDIKVKIDNSQAIAAARQVVAAEQQIEQAVRANADGRERDARGRSVATGKVRADAANEAAKAEAEGFQKSISLAGQFESSILKLGVQFAAFAGPGALVHQLAQGMKESYDNAVRFAEQTARNRDLLREAADLAGRLGGPDTGFLREQAALGVKAGMTPDEARAFATEFRAAGESRVGVNISQEEYNKLMPMAAQQATAAGLDPAMAARATGTFLAYGRNQTAEQYMAESQVRNEILKAGLGSNSVLNQQMTQAGGALLDADQGGLVKNQRELAAYIALGSQKSPERAGVFVTQLARGVRDFQGSQGQFLKETGIGEQDTLTSSMQKMFPVMQQAESQGRKLDVFLQEKGFKQEEERNALLTAYRFREFLGNQLKKADAPLDTTDVAKRLEAPFETRQDLRERRASARVAQAEQEQGLQREEFETARKNAQAGLTAGGYYTDIRKSGPDYLRSLFTAGTVAPSTFATEREASIAAGTRLPSAGVAGPGGVPGFIGETVVDAFNVLTGRNARNFNAAQTPRTPGPVAADPDMAENNATLKSVDSTLKEIAGKPKAPPQGAAPNAPKVRAGR